MLICIGGMHGNEPAGVEAIDMMVKMLEVEPITNPDFEFKGAFLGLSGNLNALKKGVRFVDRDLNRMWTLDTVDRILSSQREDLVNEEREIFDLIRLIRREIKSYQPEQVVVLDLHTTTAFGGIFTITTDDPQSIRIGAELHAPVITGMLKGIRGTSLHYFNSQNFGLLMSCVVFESGQHEERLSINRAIAAITNTMSIIGCVNPNHVENQHEQLLIEYAEGLPKVAEHIMTHPIQPGDQFRMEPGYSNFQKVHKGELLAHDVHGPIYAMADGLILMPLYQKQGDDGFFLIKEVLSHGEPLRQLWEPSASADG